MKHSEREAVEALERAIGSALAPIPGCQEQVVLPLDTARTLSLLIDRLQSDHEFVEELLQTLRLILDTLRALLSPPCSIGPHAQTVLQIIGALGKLALPPSQKPFPNETHETLLPNARRGD
jgi:hypothetical protein